MQESSLSFFFPFLAISQFGLLSHIIPFRLSSGHSGPVLTLRTDDATHTSLSRSPSLLVDTSLWATTLLAVAVRLEYGPGPWRREGLGLSGVYSRAIWTLFHQPGPAPPHSRCTHLPQETGFRAFPSGSLTAALAHRLSLLPILITDSTHSVRERDSPHLSWGDPPCGFWASKTGRALDSVLESSPALRFRFLNALFSGYILSSLVAVGKSYFFCQFKFFFLICIENWEGKFCKAISF